MSSGERWIAIARLGVLAIAWALTSACSSSRDLVVVTGVPECESGVAVSNSDDARSELESAEPGTCVVLDGESFVGPFVVPPGVGLVSQGATAVSGGDGLEPAITALEGARVVNIAVRGARGVGVAVEGASARLENVRVYGVARTGVSITCDPALHGDCTGGAVTLDFVVLESNGGGLFISGARVLVDEATIRGRGEASDSGDGIVVVRGGTIDGVALTIVRNSGSGVFVDGERSRAFIRRSSIAGNALGGVWVQRVRGTLEEPSIALVDADIADNALAVGAFDARGIALVRGSVAAIRAKTGQGLVVAGNSTDILVDGTRMYGGETEARVGAVIQDATTGRIDLFAAYASWGARPTVAVQGSRGAAITPREVVLVSPTTPVEVPAAPLPVPAQ